MQLYVESEVTTLSSKFIYKTSSEFVAFNYSNELVS